MQRSFVYNLACSLVRLELNLILLDALSEIHIIWLIPRWKSSHNSFSGKYILYVKKVEQKFCGNKFDFTKQVYENADHYGLLHPAHTGTGLFW